MQTRFFQARSPVLSRNKLLDAEELVAEHQVHKSLGLYMEDIDRPRTAPTVPLQPRRIPPYPSTLHPQIKQHVFPEQCLHRGVLILAVRSRHAVALNHNKL